MFTKTNLDIFCEKNYYKTIILFLWNLLLLDYDQKRERNRLGKFILLEKVNLYVLLLRRNIFFLLYYGGRQGLGRQHLPVYMQRQLMLTTMNFLRSLRGRMIFVVL